jgi:hypothetical protein
MLWLVGRSSFKMIVGDFELFTWLECPTQIKRAKILMKHECFELVEEDIYHLEFIVKEMKRKLDLK